MAGGKMMVNTPATGTGIAALAAMSGADAIAVALNVGACISAAADIVTGTAAVALPKAVGPSKDAWAVIVGTATAVLTGINSVGVIRSWKTDGGRIVICGVAARLKETSSVSFMKNCGSMASVIDSRTAARQLIPAGDVTLFHNRYETGIKMPPTAPQVSVPAVLAEKVTALPLPATSPITMGRLTVLG
jgi:hypothetical protein